MAIVIENSTYDPSESGYNKIPEGTYPAHVTAVHSTKFDDTGKSVYNLIFTAADEVKNLKVPKLVSDGNGGYTQDGEVSGEFIQGKTFRFADKKSMWLNPYPEKGKGWQNERYVNYSTNLGVEFPKTEDGKEIQLVEIEESDILGNPCLVRVIDEPWEYKGKSGIALKVIDVLEWKDGTKLSKDELEADDLPF